MSDLLTLTANLPEVQFAAGDVVVQEGQPGGAVWVLVSGALQVQRSGVVVNTVTQAGACIGEISALCGSTYSATVIATEPCVMRHAADGAALLARDPEITRLVAVGLAERLHTVTRYLVDLKRQYGDAPGLSMVSEVLSQLAMRQAPKAQPGSAREPDPEY